MPEYDIEVAEGTTYRLALRPMVEVDGVRTPLDLTGVTFTLRVETHDVASEIGDVTLANGFVYLTFTAVETASLTQSRRTYYGIDMHTGSDVRRILEGAITVRMLGGMVIHA